MTTNPIQNPVPKKSILSEIMFVVWAGGAALLSYSLVYALRKPFTAATFDGLSFYGMDYKTSVTIIQIAGYVIAKFCGIKIISELRKETRFMFFAASAVLAELALLLFALLPMPYNVTGLFINGLSLGCMWGVIFSFIEGRKVTDILASLLGVSMVFSSGLAKSVGLFVMNDLHISPFWMPALIGAVALPFLLLMGFLLKILPPPTAEDINLRNKRVVLDGAGRKALFLKYIWILTPLFAGNFMLLVLRDLKEDFLVDIIDMSNQSSWLFARVDSIVTLIILVIFASFAIFRNNFHALMSLMALVITGCLTLTYISFNYQTLHLSPLVWLFTISMSLYIAYLTFQTIFFDRFIACFRIKGNVGYFIAMIDFIGYMGTLSLLSVKEFLNIRIPWFDFFNHVACIVGGLCTILFTIVTVRIYKAYYGESYTCYNSKNIICK